MGDIEFTIAGEDRANNAIAYESPSFKNFQFNILSQTYSVYINNKFILTVKGAQAILINPGDNVIPLNVQFNPQTALTQLGGLKGILNIIANIVSDIFLYLKLRSLRIS